MKTTIILFIIIGGAAGYASGRGVGGIVGGLVAGLIAGGFVVMVLRWLGIMRTPD